MHKPSKKARGRKRNDSFQVGKNGGLNAEPKEKSDLFVKTVKCQRDIGELLLRTREQTHEILVRLYLIAIAYAASRKQYREFIGDQFFSLYKKKKPKPTDNQRKIFSHVLRFAYYAKDSDASGYRAANRYAKILRELAEDRCTADDVRRLLREKDAKARWDIQPLQEGLEAAPGSSLPAKPLFVGSGNVSSKVPPKVAKSRKGNASRSLGVGTSAKSSTTGAKTAEARPKHKRDTFLLLPTRDNYSDRLAKASSKEGTEVWIKAVSAPGGDFHTKYVSLTRPGRNKK